MGKWSGLAEKLSPEERLAFAEWLEEQRKDVTEDEDAEPTVSQSRKRPVAAWRFDQRTEVPEWMREAMRDGNIYWQGGDEPYFSILTLQGTIKAHRYDWVIRLGPKEFAACKPDIFEATYEPVEELKDG